MKMCNADRIPVIPYGTGTGLEAGISALKGGLCLDLSKMDRILDYHPEDFDVVVEPGVTREALNHHTKDDGSTSKLHYTSLFLPHVLHFRPMVPCRPRRKRLHLRHVRHQRQWYQRPEM